jgi:putative restriction endonuclease
VDDRDAGGAPTRSARPSNLTDPAAVLDAMRQADELGRDRFLALHKFGRGRHYSVSHAGRTYDPKAIVGVAYGVQFPQQGTLPSQRFSGGVEGANAVLQRLGFTVIDDRPATIQAEREWRDQVWSDLTSDPAWPELAASTLRDAGVYGGQQGIWVDKARTGRLTPDGLAIAVLHTGRHYADDLHDEGIVYHYPRTSRPASRDAGEVAAVKNCQQHNVSILVVSETASGARRVVRRAWVVEHDDATSLFLMRFGDNPGAALPQPAAESPFALQAPRRRTRQEVERAQRDPAFKFSILRRFKSKCVLTGVSVPEMLDAAHIVPVQNGGTDDERNGLLLTAALHRAYDAWLWSIDPHTLDVVQREQGPTLQAMGIAQPHLRDLTSPPHVHALQWRHEQFLRRSKGGRESRSGNEVDGR